MTSSVGHVVVGCVTGVIESLMSSIVCWRATGAYQHESLISAPRVMFGSRSGSLFILSSVWNVTSVLWMPYISLMSPHSRKCWVVPDFFCGWWWIEYSAPMMKSPRYSADVRSCLVVVVISRFDMIMMMKTHEPATYLEPSSIVFHAWELCPTLISSAESSGTSFQREHARLFNVWKSGNEKKIYVIWDTNDKNVLLSLEFGVFVIYWWFRPALPGRICCSVKSSFKDFFHPRRPFLAIFSN